MKVLYALVVLASLVAVVMCSQSNWAQEQGRVAVPARAPGELELEKGYVNIRPNWYQDNWGLVLEDADKTNHHRLELFSRWEKDDVLLVSVRSTMESGVEPELHFQFANGDITKCWADGKWRSDHRTEERASEGKFHDVTGVARVNQYAGALSCLFTIRGALWGDHKDDPRPDRVMGGFEIPIPAHEH